MKLGLGAIVLTGLIAAASWTLRGGWRYPRTSRPGRAAAGWAGLTAAAAAGGLIIGDPGHPAVLALLLAATASGVVGLAVPLPPGGPPRRGQLLAGAEAVLVAASVMAVFWVVIGAISGAGATTAVDSSALLALALTTMDLTALAWILRLPPRPDAAPRERHRRKLWLVAGALCCLTMSDAALTLYLLGPASPTLAAVLGLWLRAVACLLVGVVPWAPEGVAATPGRRSGTARAMPSALVVAAIGVQLLTSFQRPVGPVSLAFVALMVSGLIGVQGLGRRESARLVRDLAASRARLTALEDNAGDVVLRLDTSGIVVSANAAAARLLHRTPLAVTGLDVADLAVLAERPRLREVVGPVVHGGRSAARVQLRLAPPATGTAELRLQAVAGGAVAVLSDLTDSTALRERLEHLVRYDQMTGLPSRAHLLEEIDGWLRAGHPVTVLYADLDGFKAVNDRFGHQRGDEVLVEAAGRLQRVVLALPAEHKLVGRMGGDEFVVALSGVTPENVSIATERMLAGMRPTFAVADRDVRVGLSIGVASTADHVSACLRGAADLLHRADVALFSAKQAGRFRVRYWDAAMEAKTLRRVDIAIGLRRALDRRRLALAYQPLVRLSDGVVIGVEALIRVSSDDHGPGALAKLPDVVAPAELVSVAEDTGEIIELGQWVLDEATSQAARWRADGHDVFVTVNVSVQQMTADGFVESVSQALAAAGLPPDGLIVEITEGQLLSEADPAWRAVERLRALGVVLVIDDFGSGYSSLAYLRRLPLRGVKLDRSLLDDVTSDPRARTLARAVIAAARALGLLVIAEGLESLPAARVVRDLGAFAGQGFALFEAMPPEDITKVLAGPAVNLAANSPAGHLQAPDAELAPADPYRVVGVDLT